MPIDSLNTQLLQDANSQQAVNREIINPNAGLGLEYPRISSIKLQGFVPPKGNTPYSEGGLIIPSLPDNGPMIFPYNPTNNGIPQFPITLRLQLNQKGINKFIGNNMPQLEVECFFIVQNMGWLPEDNPLFRPHNWLHPEAQNRGFSNGASEITTRPTYGLFENLEDLNAGRMVITEFHTHLDAEGRVVYSPANAEIGKRFIQSREQSTSFYSLVVDGTRGRAALTLHWLLNDDDYQNVIDYISSRDYEIDTLNDLLLLLDVRVNKSADLRQHTADQLGSSIRETRNNNNDKVTSKMKKNQQRRNDNNGKSHAGNNQLISSGELPENYGVIDQAIVESLQQRGLNFFEVPGDGNCLYYAVALYLGTSVDHLRHIVANEIEKNPQKYRQFITLSEGLTMERYIQRIRNTTEWAGDLEINILSEVLGRPIISIGPNGRIHNNQMLGQQHLTGEPIFVYYNNINHYDALLLQEGSDPREILNDFLQRGTPHQVRFATPIATNNSSSDSQTAVSSNSTIPSDYGVARNAGNSLKPENLQFFDDIGLDFIPIEDNGDCFYYCLAHHTHKTVAQMREDAANLMADKWEQLESNNLIEILIADNPPHIQDILRNKNNYIEAIRRGYVAGPKGEELANFFADNYTVQELANKYNLQLHIMVSNENNSVFPFQSLHNVPSGPQDGNQKIPVFLFYVDGNHYHLLRLKPGVNHNDVMRKIKDFLNINNNRASQVTSTIDVASSSNVTPPRPMATNTIPSYISQGVIPSIPVINSNRVDVKAEKKVKETKERVVQQNTSAAGSTTPVPERSKQENNNNNKINTTKEITINIQELQAMADEVVRLLFREANNVLPMAIRNLESILQINANHQNYNDFVRDLYNNITEWRQELQNYYHELSINFESLYIGDINLSTFNNQLESAFNNYLQRALSSAEVIASAINELIIQDNLLNKEKINSLNNIREFIELTTQHIRLVSEEVIHFAQGMGRNPGQDIATSSSNAVHRPPSLLLNNQDLTVVPYGFSQQVPPVRPAGNPLLLSTTVKASELLPTTVRASELLPTTVRASELLPTTVRASDRPFSPAELEKFIVNQFNAYVGSYGDSGAQARVMRTTIEQINRSYSNPNYQSNLIGDAIRRATTTFAEMINNQPASTNSIVFIDELYKPSNGLSAEVVNIIKNAIRDVNNASRNKRR